MLRLLGVAPLSIPALSLFRGGGPVILANAVNRPNPHGQRPPTGDPLCRWINWDRLTRGAGAGAKKFPSFVAALMVGLLSSSSVVSLSAAPARDATKPEVARLFESYCFSCHDNDTHKGDVNLEALRRDGLGQHAETWERVVRRLQTRQMPPASRKNRPSEREYDLVVASLTRTLDAAAEARPHPGRTETVRRLNRTEYQNAVRDLLAVDVDATTLLPPDDSSHGFDNVTVGTLSPTLLERYITAAQRISHLAVGAAERAPGGDTIRVRPDLTQEEHVEGLPFGTRGGALIHYTFSRDGEYEFTIRLTRDRNDEVEGLREPTEVLLLVDREQVQSFTVKPPRGGEGHQNLDAHLKIRLPIKAGPHQVGVTFVKNPSSLLENKRQPYHAHFNFHRHPRLTPALYQVSITGPFADKPSGPGDTPSRRQLFVARPTGPSNELVCAQRILTPLLRRAWRRPVNETDVARLTSFFEEGRRQGDFDSGIEAAVAAVLVSREFLFRVESEPTKRPPGGVYAISDLELASRLSFFLWSSIPDDELLTLAEHGRLARSDTLMRQTRRMLADARAESLVRNFAAQWLYLRNLEAVTPDGRLFPDFDDNLRQAMRQETELLFSEILRDDRSVLTLIKTDHAWLNQRLAQHYGIEGVSGSHFRRVALKDQSNRGGLLRQGSILAVTSYATRTSPVLRGKWILENLLGTPPPPPPADVPSLDDAKVAADLPVRQRLAAHRDKPACAGCHEFIDPPGFALEHYDALGRWRDLEEGLPVDASGGLPDGQRFVGVDGLEKGLVDRPEVFVTTLAEKMLTFALGRGVDPNDAPAVRQMVREARAGDFRFSALVVGVVKSAPFKMRQSL